MKAAFIEKPGRVYIEEVPVPRCGDHEVLIKVKEVGICGSDLHYFQDGRIGDHVIREPHILGHECSGVVAEAGREVKHLKPGERVAIEPGVPCFSCSACLSGRYNLCDSVHFIGAPPYPGAFREYLAHDARFVFPLPESVSFTQGAMAEPLAVAYHAVRMAGLHPGQAVLIVGAGPIGFSCLEVVRVAGAAAVLVSEPQAHRRRTAESMGADLTLDPSGGSVLEAVK
jgi:L-iditol 2-dehydrogenase